LAGCGVALGAAGARGERERYGGVSDRLGERGLDGFGRRIEGVANLRLVVHEGASGVCVERRGDEVPGSISDGLGRRERLIVDPQAHAPVDVEEQAVTRAVRPLADDHLLAG
jgi:hypothetical protein